MAAVVLLGYLASCGHTTHLTTVWKDQGSTTLHFDKVLALAVTTDEGLRRAFEDAFVLYVPEASASYNFIPDEELKDIKKVKRRVKRAGYDGVVQFRVVNVEKEIRYVPGTFVWGPRPYYRPWGYWGDYWYDHYHPGYYLENQIATVEINVYSVRKHKLVWSSRTRTFNPRSIRHLVDDVVKAAANELTIQGFI